MDLTDQVGNQLIRLAGGFVKSSGEFLEELMKLLAKNKIDDPNKYTIAKHIENGGSVFTSRVQDDFVESLERHLKEQNVAYMFMDLGDGDNCKMLVIRDIDKQRAEFATKLVMAEKKQLSEFEKDEFLNMTPRSELACVSGLSLHEYEMFRDMAKNNGLKFAATISNKNEVHILYNLNDRKELDMSMKQMTWNLTGRNGDELEAIYRTKAEAQLVIKQMYQKKAQPVYLVDAHHPNQVIRIDERGIALCPHYDNDLSREANFDDDSAIFVSVSDKKYVKNASELIAKMDEPVVVKVEEMKNIEKVLAKKLPKLDKDWQMKEEQYREKYDEKLKAENDYMLDEVHAYDDGFNFTTVVEKDITFDQDEWKLDDKEKKEVDQHVHDAIVKVKTYNYHTPQEKELDKLINAARRKMTYEKAKSEVAKDEMNKAAKDRKRKKDKEKDDVRDK
ncbi:MAG: hypothetical protein UIM53_03045 [Acutalibacteraceae bacterium]|nr:hypothetical protein [Acutalibacteraceae bacterium]